MAWWHLGWRCWLWCAIAPALPAWLQMEAVLLGLRAIIRQQGWGCGRAGGLHLSLWPTGLHLPSLSQLKLNGSHLGSVR